MFENHRKSLIQHWERCELHLHFEWTNIHEKCQKLMSYWKTEFLCQTLLPDRSFYNWTNICEYAIFWMIFKHCELATYHFIPLLSCQFFPQLIHIYSDIFILFLSSIWKPATEREWSWIVGPSFASYFHADGHPHFLPHASPWPQIRPALVPHRLLRGRLE